MSEYLAKFDDGDKVTIVAAATIVGGQLVTTAGLVAGTAAVDVAGVACFDATTGQHLTLYRVGIHTGVAVGAIVNGDPLCAAAAGKIRKWVTGTDAVASKIGRAWSAAADTATVTYALFGV